MNKFPKILIIGHARHGKDSFAEILREDFGLKFLSSSQAASDIFIYSSLKDKYGYTSPEECFLDRVNHRAEWYDLICDYNKKDPARLAKEILKITDCYVGMRSSIEIEECLKTGIIDLVIWVDASGRLPLEDKSSFDINKSCADLIIENNDSFGSFKSKAIRIGKSLICK
jgi:hypothetical protein